MVSFLSSSSKLYESCHNLLVNNLNKKAVTVLTCYAIAVVAVIIVAILRQAGSTHNLK